MAFGIAKTPKVVPGQTEAKGPSFWTILDGVLGGDTISEAKFNAQAREAALAQSAQQLKMRQGLLDLLGGGVVAPAAEAAPAAIPAAPSPFAVPDLISAKGPKLAPPPAAALPALPARRRGLPTLGEAGAPLAGAILSGLPGADKLVDLLDKSQPDIAIGPDGRAYSKKDPGILGKTFGNPTVVNGRIVNLNDEKNIGEYIPEAPVKGAVPAYGPQGKAAAPIGWQLPSGALQAIEATEAAGSQGKARGAAPFEFVDVPDPQGRKRVLSKDRAAGGDFVGQSPEEAGEVENALTVRKGLPGVLAAAEQAANLIKEVQSDPELGARTGMSSMFWAIPGTKGVAFDDKVKQLKGGVFLQAFNQLKGGGAITEAEGQKAEQAIARLNQRQTQEDFVSSLNDLASVIESGTKRARSMAVSPNSRGAPAAKPSLGYSIVKVRRAGQ